jgi:hypothetical protein
MLGLAFDSRYMTFVAITEEGDSGVIEQTGLIRYPEAFQLQASPTNNIASLLDFCFKELKQQLDFPQKNAAISVNHDFHTLLIVPGEEGQSATALREKHLWETNVRFGEEYSINHLKIRHLLRDHKQRQQRILGVYYRKEFLDALENAAQANHLHLKRVIVNALSGYETIKAVYDVNTSDFSLLKLSDNYIELSVFKNNLLEGSLILPKNENDRLPVYQTGKIGKNIVKLLRNFSFGEELYKETGPVFVHATEDVQEKYWPIFEQYDMTGWIDPFANYKSIFKRYEGAEGNSPKNRVQNLFTEAAGALFEELENE